jgi:type IV secretion system protein VirB4
MLKLSDYRPKAKGLPDLLPYAALVAPGVILNKDGSFLAAWEIRGQDTDSSAPEERAYVSGQVNNAVKLLGTGWMLHTDAIRGSHRAYPGPGKGFFPDAVTRRIDDERRAFFNEEGGRCFSTNTVLAVTWKPDFGASDMAGKVQAGAGRCFRARFGKIPAPVSKRP